jgi:hypothetical protein
MGADHTLCGGEFVKRHVLEISGAILLCAVVYLSYPLDSFLLSPLALFGSRTGSAELFYDLAPEPMRLHKWHLAAPRFSQFCLGLCTNKEFQQ